MQATVTFYLTEEAQRAAIAATGQPIARKQVKTIEVTGDDLALLRVDIDGNPYLDLTGSPAVLEGTGVPVSGLGRDFRASSIPHIKALLSAGCQKGQAQFRYQDNGSVSKFDIPLIPDANADLLHLIRTGEAKVAAEEERRRLEQEEVKRKTHLNGLYNFQLAEEAYQKFLADPNARMDGYNPRIPGEKSPADWWPYQHEQFVAEIRRRNAADIESATEAERQKEKAQQEFIKEWIEQNATEETKQQFADGLLDRKDTLSLIADSELDMIAAEYDPKSCRAAGCPCGSEKIESLPRSVYPALRALKNKLPKGSTVELRKFVECVEPEEWGEGGAPEAVFVARINVPIGPFTFNRLVRLDTFLALDCRYDDLKSGEVQPVDGEKFFKDLGPADEIDS